MRNKKITIFVSVFVIVVIIFFFFWSGEKDGITTLNETTMTLSSPAFEDGGIIPSLYTCRGEGNHPPLEIGGVPTGAASLVLTVNDPDAISGDFIHWIVWNIDPDTREIKDSVPAGSLEGANSVGKGGYIAPCPPSGTHRYYFKLFALDTKLDLSETADNLELEEAIAGHVLDQAQLMGLVSADE